MELRREEQDGVSVVYLDGSIDSLKAPAIQEQLLATLGDAPQPVLLDLSGVDYISGAGLRVLLVFSKKIRTQGAAFGVCGLRPQVADVLTMAGFDTIISAYSSTEAALAAMGK